MSDKNEDEEKAESAETTEATESKVEVEPKSPYLSHQVAYDALSRLVTRITTRIKQQLNDLAQANILIVNDLEYAPKDFALVEISTRLDLFNKHVGDQHKKNKEILKAQLAAESQTEAFAGLEIVGILSGALSAIGIVADIVGHFRSDYKAHGQSFDMAQKSLLIAVAGQLGKDQAIREKVNVYIEDFYSLTKESPIIEAFENAHQLVRLLQSSRNAVQKEIVQPAEKRISKEEKSVTALVKALEKLPAGDPQRADLEEKLKGLRNSIKQMKGSLKEPKAAIERSNHLISGFEKFAKAIFTTAEGASYPKIVLAAVRSQIDKLKVTHLLHLDIVSSGGYTVTSSQTLIQNGRLSSVGGLATTFLLADKNGKVIEGDTIFGASMVELPLDLDRNIQWRNVENSSG